MKIVYSVYILYSKKLDKYYVGQSSEFEKRLENHLSGISRYTSIAKDWVCVYKEDFHNRTKAIRREREIKKKTQY